MNTREADGKKVGTTNEAPDGREVPEQPRGTTDRTRHPDEGNPRDVDEGFGRHGIRDVGQPGGEVQTTSDGSMIKPRKA
jgi:hypothetical protein